MRISTNKRTNIYYAILLLCSFVEIHFSQNTLPSNKKQNCAKEEKSLIMCSEINASLSVGKTNSIFKTGKLF